MTATATSATFRILPVTPGTWPLFEDLFGPGGLHGGCWCAFFRMAGPSFDRSSPDEHKEFVHRQVQEGKPFGLLAVSADQRAHGWVAVAPRADCQRLERSTVAHVAEPTLTGVWSVTCFYTHPRARRRSLTKILLDGAVTYAHEQGARVIEGYPVDSGDLRLPSGSLYHGELRTFLAAGFELIERRGIRRALVRRLLGAC